MNTDFDEKKLNEIFDLMEELIVLVIKYVEQNERKDKDGRHSEGLKGLERPNKTANIFGIGGES